MFRTSRRLMVAREAEDKELGMADSGCMLTVFVAWWYIVQRKPGIDKALQEACRVRSPKLFKFLTAYMSHRHPGANSPNLSLAVTSPFRLLKSWLLTFQMPKCSVEGGAA